VKDQRIVMGMPVTVEIADEAACGDHTEEVFAYFKYVEDTFSPYAATSETSRINHGLLGPDGYSEDMRTIMRLAEKTRVETNGYFDVYRSGIFNPVGLVKGWAINNAADMLRHQGLWDFYIEAGGDIQVSGLNDAGGYWVVGIRNPFQSREIVKVLYLSDIGIATSGTYVRGDHIYDPNSPEEGPIEDIVSLTVVGPNVYEADRYATAAFAMGRPGLDFIEEMPGFEGYLIDKDGIATMTSGFEDHMIPRPLGRGRGVTP
jgi:thiamine biosynthesis lipoprotein